MIGLNHHALEEGPVDHDPPDLCRVAVARGLKMLTKTLGKLGLGGPVGRNVYSIVPPKVEYPLTRPGRT